MLDREAEPVKSRLAYYTRGVMSRNKVAHGEKYTRPFASGKSQSYRGYVVGYGGMCLIPIVWMCTLIALELAPLGSDTSQCLVGCSVPSLCVKS